MSDWRIIPAENLVAAFQARLLSHHQHWHGKMMGCHLVQAAWWTLHGVGATRVLTLMWPADDLWRQKRH